jgi:hypothetical protein
MYWTTQAVFYLLFQLSAHQIIVTASTAAPFSSNTTKLPAPPNCRKLPIDADWPSEEIWKSELKGAEPLMEQKQKIKHPNYIYEASTVVHVQNAVNFAAEHNVRLSIINSGHDFLGRLVEHSDNRCVANRLQICLTEQKLTIKFSPYRNDAPSGVLLALERMKGIRVLESFTPTAQGAEPVNFRTVTNAIWPTSGKQAAVTIGAGVTGLEMSAALAKSGLFALFASHGK